MIDEPLTPEGGSVNALDAEQEMLAAVYKLQEVAPSANYGFEYRCAGCKQPCRFGRIEIDPAELVCDDCGGRFEPVGEFHKVAPAFLPENTELALLDDSDNPRPVESTGPEEFIQDEPDAAIPGWFVEIPLEDRGCALLALEMVPAIESLVDKEKKKDVVRQFVELVKQNIAPEVAARRLSKKLPQRPLLQQELKRLLNDYAWNADADRAIVRAGRRKVATEALRDGDAKVSLAALEAIASDPEVGLKAPPVTNINVNMGNLGAVFEAVEKDDYQVIDIGEVNEGKV